MVSTRPSRKAATKATEQIKAKKPTQKKAAAPKKSKATTPKKAKRATTKRAASKPRTKKAAGSTTPKKPRTPKVQKDDTAVVITDAEDNLETLFRGHVSKELLVELLQCNNVTVPRTAKKDAVVAKLMETTVQKGQQVVVDRLTKKTLAAFTAEVKGSEPNHPNNKGELQKELRELIEKAGSFDEAVTKLKVETIDAICQDLNFKEEGSRKDKVEGLADEARLLGAKALFDRVQYTFLKELCGKLGLSAKGQKEHLVARFLGQSYRFLLDEAKVPPKEKKEKGEKKAEKGKKKEKVPGPDVSKIAKGVSSEDLHQYYTEQLSQYMKDNELKKGKNKREMVKIIQSFLDGDESVLQKNQVPKTNKRKRKAESGDNDANKKQKTSE